MADYTGKLQPRWSDEAVHELQRKPTPAGTPRVYSVEIRAPAGSVVLFDTSNLHRGKESMQRSDADARWSMTTYYQKPVSQYGVQPSPWRSVCDASPSGKIKRETLTEDQDRCRSACLR